MSEVRSVLDANEHTLRHLVLGASLERQHSWDLAFQSSTIKNLTHLDLVDTKISHIVLARIAHAHNLQSLTLHGTLEEPASARVVFGSDQIIDGQHTFLPHLEAFRFILVGHPEDAALYQSVVQFLRHRKGLRRLDLGSCPWETTVGVLPELTGLRVLGVKIPNLSPGVVDSLVNALPRELMALSVSMSVSDQSLVCGCLLACSSVFNLIPLFSNSTNTRIRSDASTNSLSFISKHLPNVGQSQTSFQTRITAIRPTCGIFLLEALLHPCPLLTFSDGTANIISSSAASI